VLPETYRRDTTHSEQQLPRICRPVPREGGINPSAAPSPEVLPELSGSGRVHPDAESSTYATIGTSVESYMTGRFGCQMVEPLSTKLWRVIPLLTMAVSACVGPTVPVPGFFRYEQRTVDGFLEQSNVEQEWVAHVGRDSTGGRLYLYGFSDAATILDVDGELAFVPEKPSPVAYLNDKGQWAAWLAGGKAHFQGWSRPAKRLWTDPGTRHYLIRTQEETLELGTVDGRLKESLDGFDPLGVFAHDNRVYVFGVWVAANETRCLVFHETRSGYELVETVTIAPFAWPVSIVDMDLSAERVVVARGLDFRSYWLVFDFRDRTRHEIGRVSTFGVFLREDILAIHAATR